NGCCRRAKILCGGFSRLATEFGRTARINGTDGTDHGTATVGLPVGGALNGGRAIRRLAWIKASESLPGPRSPTDDRSAPYSRSGRATHCAPAKRHWRRLCSPGSEAVKPIAGLVA